MNLTFLNAGLLSLLLLVPLFAIFLLWRRSTYEQRFKRLGDLDLVRQLTIRQNARFAWRSGLWLTCLAALIIALARPVWGVNTDVIEVTGVSVVVVLDVSNSMLAQDLLPSRLERAKLGIHDVLEELRGNEVALVVFAGTAFAQFPLTNDIDSAQSFVRAVDTAMITQQGTVIEDALRQAMNLFDTQRPSAKIIVLATDGEAHEGDIEAIVQEIIARGITVYSLGYGDEDGAPVPILSDDGEVVAYKADPSGQMVLSRLDETTLQTIARETGGIYQRASASGTEITNLIRLINDAETGLLDNRIESRSVERFGIFVLVAVIALSLEMLLPMFNRTRS
ncbi:MAG: hypothetical protein CL610_09345 [Anaerolineaceae bacterium]|nr:hypothetical protein [Anaerolineaceae bacterium]